MVSAEGLVYAMLAATLVPALLVAFGPSYGFARLVGLPSMPTTLGAGIAVDRWDALVPALVVLVGAVLVLLALAGLAAASGVLPAVQ